MLRADDWHWVTNFGKAAVLALEPLINSHMRRTLSPSITKIMRLGENLL